MTNPYETPQGIAAQRNLFRVLATGDGPMADFAKAVVTGRMAPRDVLSEGWVRESVMDDLIADADRFHRLPEAEREALVAGGPAFADEFIGKLASLDVEAIEAELKPPPPKPARVEDDDEESPSLLKDAW